MQPYFDPTKKTSAEEKERQPKEKILKRKMTSIFV
jgi:hypothetical protein